jgi:hypothetical protein
MVPCSVKHGHAWGKHFLDTRSFFTVALQGPVAVSPDTIPPCTPLPRRPVSWTEGMRMGLDGSSSGQAGSRISLFFVLPRAETRAAAHIFQGLRQRPGTGGEAQLDAVDRIPRLQLRRPACSCTGFSAPQADKTVFGGGTGQPGVPDRACRRTHFLPSLQSDHARIPPVRAAAHLSCVQ